MTTCYLGGALKYKKEAVTLAFKMKASVDPGNHRCGSWAQFTNKLLVCGLQWNVTDCQKACVHQGQVMPSKLHALFLHGC